MGLSKEDIITKVKELDLPDGEYVVVGSGILGALDIRTIDDIDLIVSPSIRKEFESKSDWKEEVKWGKTFLSKGKFDMFSQLSWEEFSVSREKSIASATIIDGVPFMSVENILAF